ncbi:MAG: RNA-directed DNA polymerase [Methanolobus sp.]|nr:RNA-directed DNA polymerase [Methanolobus sp.]
MPELDNKILDAFDFDISIERILSDIKTDFIFAPHLDVIYEYNSKDFIEILKKKLLEGDFKFSTPITLDIPKKSRLSRPGSILLPFDRLVYQAIIDFMASEIESNISRDHVFSNIYANTSDMFESHTESYNNFKEYIYDKSLIYDYCIRMDVASYFESINQHFLINLLYPLGFDARLIKFLEKALSSWSYKNSYSILQGLYGSDVLGNFNLTNLDYFLELKDYDYCRYVDDYYIFHDDKEKLHKLLIVLCNKLRKQNLFLNEKKTELKQSLTIFFEETEFDTMFHEINQMLSEVLEEDSEIFKSSYGFQIEFDAEESEEKKLKEIDGFKINLIEELYSKRNEAKWQRDDIIKFCIPLFSKSNSLYPVDTLEEEIVNNPHLAKYYATYFASIDKENADVTSLIEDILISNKLIYEYQIHWLFSSLLYRKGVSSQIIDFAVKCLINKQIHETIRSICAILISKFGSGNQLRTFRDEYEHESSYFVKAAMAYGTRYLSKSERQACRSAWSGHSELNNLVFRSIAKYNEEKNN